MLMLPPDPLYIFKGEMLPVSCVAFKITPVMERIYAGTQSGNVHVWNLKSRREIGNFKAGEDTCLSVCIPREEDVVITHTKSGCISFWGECDMKTMNSTETVRFDDCDSGEIMAFKVCEISRRRVILIAYEAHKLGLWDLGERKKISGLQLDECPMAIDYDVNSNKGLCGDPSDTILIFSLDKNLEFKTVRKLTLTNPGVAAVRIRPDGKLVAVGCWDGKVRLYSWKTLVLLAVLDTHDSTVQEVCFSETYKEGSKVKYLLVAGSQDARISLWDLYN